MLSKMRALLEPLAAHGARVATVATVDTKDVGLNVRIARKQFKANTTRVLVAQIHVVQLRIVIVFLVDVRLQHDSALDRLITVLARVRRVDVLVVGCARQLVH